MFGMVLVMEEQIHVPLQKVSLPNLGQSENETTEKDETLKLTETFVFLEVPSAVVHPITLAAHVHLDVTIRTVWRVLYL